MFMRDFEREPIYETVRESITIHAPMERCFLLSTRVELVRKTLGMNLVGGVTEGHVVSGSRVQWRGWKFGLPTRHHSLITAYAEPHTGARGDRADADGYPSEGRDVAWFEDSQERGRFKAFRHEHLFRQLEDGAVLLEDHVFFALPFGWPGRLVARWVMAPHIRRLARQRFRMIKELAEGDGWREWVSD